MARLITLFSFILVISASSLQAQNPEYPYGLNMKSLFMDYQSQNGGDISNFSAYHHGFEISAQKSINRNINVVVPFKYGVVRSHSVSDVDYIHKRVFGLDAQVQYQFFQPESVMNTYVMAGVGAVTETEGDFNMQIPFGVGFHFKVADNAYINWQSEYRYALADDRNNLHHGVGFTFLFGAKKDMPLQEMSDDNADIIDSDNDGLEDDIDLCPQIYGPKELKGCPDRDEDGIPDYRDDCPSIAGLAIFKGCPDSDEDGVSDSDDECPNMAGTIENKGCPNGTSPDNKSGNDGMETKDEDNIGSNDDIVISISDRDNDGVADSDDRCPSTPGSISAKGCPDADGDGIADYDDKCPNSPGIKAMNGCPDSDGDGIDDSRDKCPDTPGSVAANGCPGIAEADLTTLETAMRAVSFDTGKATLKPSSYPILNQIANIMGRYPNYNLSIEGHTDNVGSAVNNQLLSERRARACYEYLERKGISGSRMNYTGYGEVSPISDNDSLSGRSLNRRVQFNLRPR